MKTHFHSWYPTKTWNIYEQYIKGGLFRFEVTRKKDSVFTLFDIEIRFDRTKRWVWLWFLKWGFSFHYWFPMGRVNCKRND